MRSSSSDSDPVATAYDYPLLVKQLLHTPLATCPEQEIVYRDRMRYSYREFRRRVGRLASMLAKTGVEEGTTVAVMDWDSHRYLECYFAIPMMGAVLMTVNVRLAPDQILYTIDHSHARVLLVHRDFLPVLAQIRDRLESIHTVVLLDDAPAASELPIEVDGEYENLLGTARSDFDFPDFEESRRATTFYTTGTTGLPKGVYFSHRQLVLHTLATATALGTPMRQGRLHRDDVYMPITPMFHVHAWGLPYVATLLGLKQVYPGRYVPDELLALIEREKVTFSHCVPTILHMLLGRPAAAGAPLEGWKVIIGGSALPKGLAQAALDRGIDVFAGYGMSETGPILTLAQVRTGLAERPGGELAIRTRTGQPVPLVELRVVDEAMQDVPHDGRATGEIVVRAPWLTKGYRENPQATEALWAGGYMHTGDVGSIDADGYLQISDRIKDVIKTGGEWVSSLEIEDAVSRHPAVSEVAVIGVKDEKWGERPLVLVVLRAEHLGKVDRSDIQQHLKECAERGAISKYAATDNVRFVESIERTSVGKLDKKVLRGKYGSSA